MMTLSKREKDKKAQGTQKELPEDCSELLQVHKSPHRLFRLVFDVVIPAMFRRGDDPPSWLHDECVACFNTIFDVVANHIDIYERRRILVDMCGQGDLGVVAPTHWPVP